MARHSILIGIFSIAALLAEPVLAGPGGVYHDGCQVPPRAAASDPGTEIEAWLAGDADPVPVPVADDAAVDPDAGCLACHGNAGLMIGMVKPAEAPPEDGCASAPTRPEFLNAFVNAEFPDSLHGQLGCVGCHGGDGSASDMDGAHVDMKDAEAGCATCHGEIVEVHKTSLHQSLSGMAHALELRAGAENMSTLEPMWEADCATCHTTCSDCHITLPKAVGGGLIKGHEFLRRAPMEESCALCHGSRAGGEYLGTHEGIDPDIHFEAGMHCLDCHKNDLHGDGNVYEARWDVEGRAQCTDCHAALPDASVMAHDAAHSDVACQVCHAQPYQNCFDCHTGEEDGEYFRRAGSKDWLLRIGKNTHEGYPYGIVTLRSNPVARQSFDYLGEDLLPMFDDHPTWKTVAPHNIRRVTAQNASCGNCHGDDSIFLSPDEIEPDDAAANAGSVLPRD